MRDWSDELLDSMSREQDPLADQTVREIFADGEVAAVNSLFRELTHNASLPPDLPVDLQDYVQASSQLPDWADPAKIARAQECFAEEALVATVCLWHASLPECYVLGQEAAVLGLTGQLVRHANRRVHETARMVFPVMAPGGLGPQGDGIRQVQKVRLMHAAVRHLIQSEGPSGPAPPPDHLGEVLVRNAWDIEKHGVPINQEQLAYTLLTFSYVVLRALRILDVRWNRDQEEAYLHTWNVVGHLVGVREELMAHDMDEAARLFQKIQQRRAANTEAGEALTSALLGVIQDLLPWRALRPLPVMLCRRLVEPGTAEKLGLNQHYGLGTRLLFAGFLGLMRVGDYTVGRIYREFAPSRWLGKVLGRKILKTLLLVSETGPSRPFALPTELASGWE